MADKSRRGFLRSLGLGAVAVVGGSAAALGERVVGADEGKVGGDRTAFNFMCGCGAGHVAEVPLVGETLKVDCECGESYELTWRGDKFDMKRHWVRPEEFATADLEGIR